MRNALKRAGAGGRLGHYINEGVMKGAVWVGALDTIV